MPPPPPSPAVCDRRGGRTSGGANKEGQRGRPGMCEPSGSYTIRCKSRKDTSPTPRVCKSNPSSLLNSQYEHTTHKSKARSCIRSRFHIARLIRYPFVKLRPKLVLRDLLGYGERICSIRTVLALGARLGASPGDAPGHQELPTFGVEAERLRWRPHRPRRLASE